MPAKQLTTSQVAWKNIKENPIKSLTGIIVIISFVFGVIFWIDNRYAHAGAIEELQIQQEQREVKRLDNLIQMIDLREQFGQPNMTDKPMRKSYVQQRKDAKDAISELK